MVPGIDPKVDYAFKRLFGHEHNVSMLMHMLNAILQLPPGSRIADTRAVTDTIARNVRARTDVNSVFINGGRVMGSGAEVRKATLVINIVPKEKRKLTQDQADQMIQRMQQGGGPMMGPGFGGPGGGPGFVQGGPGGPGAGR